METEVLRKDRAGDHDYRIEVYFERTKQFSEHLLTKATDTLRNTNASKRKNEKKGGLVVPAARISVTVKSLAYICAESRACSVKFNAASTRKAKKKNLIFIPHLLQNC